MELKRSRLRIFRPSYLSGDKLRSAMSRVSRATLLLCLICGATALAAPPRSPAKPVPPHPANDEESFFADPLKEGLTAYDELDYPRCVSKLRAALAESLTRAEKISVYKTLGFCHAALDQPKDAKLDFMNVLRLDESFELDRRVSPRIRAPFEEAKAAIATGQDAAIAAPPEPAYPVPSVLPELSPPQPKEGQALTVFVHSPNAEKAQIFYRTRGQSVFSRALASGKEGRFAVTVPGLHVQPPAVEFYLVLIDETGAAVARAGALAQPLAVDVQAQKRPVYTRGWFWGVIGGIAAAGAVVGLAVGLTASRGPSATSSATVTIQPQ
jgi:hypothetical protein